jgi:opacity protein-like surface antigen
MRVLWPAPAAIDRGTRPACRCAAIIRAVAFALATTAVAPAAAQEVVERIAKEKTVPDARVARVEQSPARPPATPVARRERLFSIIAYLQFGRLSHSADDSFTAILGTSSGQVFGAGAELMFRSGIFVRGDASYFGDDGERVEMVDGEIVPLGIALSLSLTPVEFSGGYRLPAYKFGRRGQITLVPCVGAGAGVVRYHEETDDAHPGEKVTERFTSYHVLLGLDAPLGRRVAIGAEFRRRWVPGGLGTGGISQALGETDLGGSAVLTRVRIIF